MKNIVYWCSLLVWSTVTMAQSSVDPDWPCIQALVPELSIGVYWPETLTDTELTQWKKNGSLASLAHKLGTLDNYDNNSRQQIVKFIENTAKNERITILNQLAFGTLTHVNRRRSKYIRGIKRYTRQQVKIALQIEIALNRLAEMDDANVDGSSKERVDLAETLYWQERIFDQREHAMSALCEQPIFLEQTVSDTLRDMALQLP